MSTMDEGTRSTFEIMTDHHHHHSPCIANATASAMCSLLERNVLRYALPIVRQTPIDQSIPSA